ncbi:MAG TPA: hypothetical protein VFE25_15900, partial [Opitutaceae bacterium]|nr:hypothetical protein [Opitutaceae bacterium]
MDDNGDTSSSRTLWRSLEDSSRGARPGAAGAEFGFGASDWMPGMDRKEFLRLMGASLALGGLSGCIRPSRDSMVPYVAAPEDGPVEDPTFYASTMPVEGFGRGILVETHFGRPTKIEGNPDHPESQGASDATTQASVLGLYDPDRSRVALREGKTADWAAFEAEWERRRPGLASSRGEGFTFLTEPTTSPTLLRQVRLFLEDYPRATWYQHTPLPVYTWKGGQEDYSIGSAEVILSLGSDFLFRHPASLRYSRQFAEARRHSVNGGMRPRLYVIEASPTPTGSLADARLPASPGRMRAVLGVVASMMAGTADLEALSTSERRFVDALVADLRDHSPRVACIAGAEQRDDIQAWARSMNLMLGDAGGVISRRTALRSDGDPRCTGDARELASAVESGSVATLVILSSNPAYTSPEFRGAKLLSKVPFTIHLGSHVDETARECTWHLPETHFLETWGDLRGYDGTGSFQQPMIEPLFGGRSAIEFLSLLRTGIYLPGYEIVRETWSA